MFAIQLPCRVTKNVVFLRVNEIFRKVGQWAVPDDRGSHGRIQGFGTQQAFLGITSGVSIAPPSAKRSKPKRSVHFRPRRTRKEAPFNIPLREERERESSPYTLTTQSPLVCSPGKRDAACVLTLCFATKEMKAFRFYSSCRETWESEIQCKAAAAQKCGDMHHCGLMPGLSVAEGRREPLDYSGLECPFSAGTGNPFESTAWKGKCSLVTQAGYGQEIVQCCHISSLSEKALCEVGGSSAGFSSGSPANVPSKRLSLSDVSFNFSIASGFGIEQKDSVGGSEESTPFLSDSMVAADVQITGNANKCPILESASRRRRKTFFPNGELNVISELFVNGKEVIFDNMHLSASGSIYASAVPNILSSLLLYFGTNVRALAPADDRRSCSQNRGAHCRAAQSPSKSSISPPLPQSTRGAETQTRTSSSKSSATARAIQLVDSVPRDYYDDPGQEKKKIYRCAKAYEKKSTDHSHTLRCSDRKRKIMNGTEYIRRKTGHRGRIKRNSQAPAYKRRLRKGSVGRRRRFRKKWCSVMTRQRRMW